MGWSWRFSWLKNLFEAVLANFGPRWDTPFVGNLGQLGDKLGGQDGPRWGLNGHLGVILGGILRNCLDLGRDFCKADRSVKHCSAFAMNWESWGCLGASGGLSCAILAISWAMFGNLGAMWDSFPGKGSGPGFSLSGPGL